MYYVPSKYDEFSLTSAWSAILAAIFQLSERDKREPKVVDEINNLSLKNKKDAIILQ